MSNTQLASILLKHSAKRYHIHYDGYLFNHMSHGIVALARLGADPERIDRFVKWYCPRLEDAGKYQDSTQIADVGELLGKNKFFYSLIVSYEEQLQKEFGGSMEKLIDNAFPKLFPGLLGAALHGIIHLGYGYAGKSTRVVCEGLAYMHYSHLPLSCSSKNALSLSAENIGRGDSSIINVLNDIRANQELINFMKAKSAVTNWEIGEFSTRVHSLFAYRGDELLKYASQVQIPGIYQMLELDGETRCRALIKWLLNSALAVYTYADKHDFFLLHGVTAAWSILQVAPLAVGKSKQLTLDLATTYLCALFATYLSQGVPSLCIEHGNRDSQPIDWETLVQKTLAEDRDEHAYKLIQVCYEMSKETTDQNLQKLYISAVLRALDQAFTFS